jgi:hypothetical protein
MILIVLVEMKRPQPHLHTWCQPISLTSASHGLGFFRSLLTGSVGPVGVVGMCGVWCGGWTAVRWCVCWFGAHACAAVVWGGGWVLCVGLSSCVCGRRGVHVCVLKCWSGSQYP